MQMDHLPSHEVEASNPIRSSFVIGVGRGFGGGGGSGCPSYHTNHHAVHHPARATAAVATGVIPTILKEERPCDSPSPPSPPPPGHPIQPLNANGPPSPPLPAVDASNGSTHVANKGVAPESSSYVYRECLRNHAASIGGNATDGCGEFMPGGSDGAATSPGDVLMCSACGCHRNFHRKELVGGFDGGASYLYSTSRSREGTYYPPQHMPYLTSRKVVGQKGVLISTAAACTAVVPYRQPHHLHHQPNLAPTAMALPLHAAPAPESDHDMDQQADGGHAVFGCAYPTNVTAPFTPGAGMMLGYGGKKRFRTKFTPEQKKRMLAFAERIGWRLQRREEAEVQRFCQEIGVKRRVLKVWMHNNKHNRSTCRGIGSGTFPNIVSGSNGDSGDHHHDDSNSVVVHHDACGHDDNGRDLNHGNHLKGFAAAPPLSHPQPLQHHHHPASSDAIQVED